MHASLGIMFLYIKKNGKDACRNMGDSYLGISEIMHIHSIIYTPDNHDISVGLRLCINHVVLVLNHYSQHAYEILTTLKIMICYFQSGY